MNAQALTDDPAAAGASNPITFVVSAAAGVANVPTLDPALLLALAAILAVAATKTLVR